MPSRQVLRQTVISISTVSLTVRTIFYPDNPQNYQISQLYLPICYDGAVEIETSAGKKTVRIHEMHMEEDAGKLIHDEWEDCSLVDYNRSGGTADRDRI